VIQKLRLRKVRERQGDVRDRENLENLTGIVVAKNVEIARSC